MICFHSLTVRFRTMRRLHPLIVSAAGFRRTQHIPERSPIPAFGDWRCETSTHIRRVSAAPGERCRHRSRWEAERRRRRRTGRTRRKWRRKKSTRRQRREGRRTGMRQGPAWRRAGWGRHMWCQAWGCWHWSVWQPSSQSNSSDPFVPAETKCKTITDRGDKDGEGGWGGRGGGGARREKARRVGGIHLCKRLVHFWGTACDHSGAVAGPAGEGVDDFVAKSSVPTRATTLF